MGRLIDTGVECDGHASHIVYSDSEPRCVLTCSCGWSTPITSYQDSWSVIEVKAKFSRHLPDALQLTGDQGES